MNNVERGYRNGLQRKRERNTKDLCWLHGQMRFQLRGSRDPGYTAERTTVYPAMALEQSFHSGILCAHPCVLLLNPYDGWEPTGDDKPIPLRWEQMTLNRWEGLKRGGELRE